MENKKNKFDFCQEEEIRTWVIDDETVRRDKVMREKSRYPYIVKQMGLTSCIDTSNMVIIDGGAGPLGGVSQVLPHKKRILVDPLKDAYSKYFDTTLYIGEECENLKERWAEANLITITNALDHMRDPQLVMEDINKYAQYSCYLSIFSPWDNALTHVHEAHQWNLNPNWVHSVFDAEWETVWELKYPELRYGWQEFSGKRGQPAFTTLFRKTTHK